MSLIRRRFIQVFGITLTASALPPRARAVDVPMGATDLTIAGITPLADVISDAAAPCIESLLPAAVASTWGINGGYLGPTMRLFNGDDVKLIYNNRLNEPVAMTISGLQVPGTLMGGAARMMSPGADWSPVYDPPASGGFLGDTLPVNGAQNPFVEVSRG